MVTLYGELDVAASARLGAALGDLIDDQGNLTVVVDLAHAGRVDAAGVGVLAAAAKLADHHGGELTLRHGSGEVLAALEAAGVADVLGGRRERPSTALGDHGRPSEHRRPGAAGAGAGARVSEHRVVFYESEEVLARSVAEHLAAAVREDGAAVVVATRSHCELFEAWLELAGLDVDRARRTGRYVDLDAEEALSQFMVDGAPDAPLFEQRIGRLVSRAAAQAGRVFVYGEMVALLWAEGNVTATIALEDLWNDLGSVVELSLLCAYPLAAFDGPDTSWSLRTICEQHR